jgi:hypothetical protein
LPGDTSRNAATITAASVTGATPNSRAFISVLRPLQARVQPAAPAGLASRDRPGTPRRGGAAGWANGPAAGCPLGYQPTVGPSSGSGGGTDAAGAGPGADGAGPGAGGAGSGADGAGPGADGAGSGAGGAGPGAGGGGGEEAPKLGGIPPGLACSP